MAREFQLGIDVTSFNSQSLNQAFLLILFFFFSLTLLVTFLLLHFICRRDSLSSNSTSRNHQQTSSSNTNTDTISIPVPAIALTTGLDAATINSIPIFLHGSLVAKSMNAREECCICLGIFEDDEMVKVLPECLHAYHPECVDKWLKDRSSCPLCRSSIDSSATNESIPSL